MKKFFKALALVLALALVIGVVPAQATSAKIKAKKTLYVDGAKGTSTDGKKASAIKGRVAIYKLAGDKKADAADHTYKAVIKSGDSVTKTKKYVYAADLGKSVVEIFKDDKSLGTSVITVKKNATADTLTLTGLEDGQEVVCGVTYTVTLPRKGVDSDERRLFVDDKAVADKEDAPRAYDVVFTTAGEHKIKFEAFQSTELDAVTTPAKEITVKAVMPKIVSAKQLTSNSFAATFASSVKGLIDPSKISNQDVYYLIADKPVVTGMIKSVVVDEDDPTNVVITFYSDFKNAEKYFFKFGDSDPVSFTTATNGSKYVDKIKISLATTYIGQANAITVKYLNKDGVEIKPTAGDKAVFESSNNAAAYIDVANDAVFFCSEETVTIKATFFTGDYDSETFVPVTAEDSITVAGVNKTAATVASTKYSFDGDTSHEKHTIRVGAAASQFVVAYKLSDNTDYVSGTNFNIDGIDWKIQSTDETVVMIQGTDKVVANKMGNATIVLYNKDTKGNWQVFDAFAITVDQQNHGATATVTVSKDTYNASSTEDVPQLKVVVKDLDGETYNAANYKVSVKQVDYNAQASSVTLTTEWTNQTNFGTQDLGFDVSALAASTSGRVSFNVKVVDTVSGNTLYNAALAVAVGKYAPADANGYVLKATKTELDTSIKYYDPTDPNANPVASSVISIVKVANTSNGQFFVANDAWDSIPANGVIPVSAAATEQKYLVINFPQGYSTAATKSTDTVVISGASITIKNFTGAADIRALAGTYTVTAYKATFDATSHNRTGMSTIGSVSVLVKKSDVAPTFVVKSNGTQGKAEFLEANINTLANVFKVTWGSINSDSAAPQNLIALAPLGPINVTADNYGLDSAFVTHDKTTGAYYVKKIGYTVTVYNINFTGELAINTLFKD